MLEIKNAKPKKENDAKDVDGENNDIDTGMDEEEEDGAEESLEELAEEESEEEEESE